MLLRSHFTALFVLAVVISTYAQCGTTSPQPDRDTDEDDDLQPEESKDAEHSESESGNSFNPEHSDYQDLDLEMLFRENVEEEVEEAHLSLKSSSGSMVGYSSRDPLDEYAGNEFSGDESPSISRSWIRNSEGRGSIYAQLLTFRCPTRPGKPDKNSRGIVLYLHNANAKKEHMIREDKIKIWRDKDIDSLVDNGFNTSRPTIIYLGGWLHTHEAAWILEARNFHNKVANDNDGEAPYNMLIFDWSNYGLTNYVRAVSMVPYIGKILGNLLVQLIDRQGYKAELAHIVCFSLSTHISGLGARHVKENERGVVSQITALDPTGVCFHRKSDQNWGSKYGLRPTDAKLVVARHYNMLQLGAGNLIGGVDIKVNGGTTQPRMLIKNLSLKGIMDAAGWANGNHHRAVQHEATLFDEDADCQDMAYECTSFTKFRQGQCADCGPRNQSCMLMSTTGNIVLGQRPPDINYRLGTRMHITTGVTQFCVYHYQVVAQLNSEPSSSERSSWVSGQFRVGLDVNVKARPRYKLGKSFTQMLRLDKRIEKFPKKLKLKGTPAAKLLNSIESLSIKFMSHISAEERHKNSAKYCPNTSGEPELVICS